MCVICGAGHVATYCNHETSTRCQFSIASQGGLPWPCDVLPNHSSLLAIIQMFVWWSASTKQSKPYNMPYMGSLGEIFNGVVDEPCLVIWCASPCFHTTAVSPGAMSMIDISMACVLHALISYVFVPDRIYCKYRNRAGLGRKFATELAWWCPNLDKMFMSR